MNQDYIHLVRVRLLTLNLFLRPPLIKNNSSDFKQARTEHFINSVLPYYDVICLQEVFRRWNKRAQQIITAAAEQGFIYSVKSPRSTKRSVLTDGGLLLLSRYEVIEIDFVAFDQGEFPDSISNKGLLSVRLRIGNHPVTLLTTHLQSSYPTRNEVKYLSYRHTRRSQLMQIRDYIDQKKLTFCVIAGDLNVDAREQVKAPQFTEVPSTDDYEMMLSILGRQGELPITDIVQQRYGYHPPTFGRTDADGQPLETTLTLPEENCKDEALDYVLLLGEPPPWFTPVIAETGLAAFQVFGKPFTQLSDHVGVHFTFTVTRTNV